MKYKFEINEKLPSLNEYIVACRTNKFIGAKLKEDVENNIWVYINNGLKTKFEKPIKINFTWVEKDRRRDLDNICFAKKFILDALVKSGKLKNDTQNYVRGFTDSFLYDKKNKVIVEIEEIDEINCKR